MKKIFKYAVKNGAMSLPKDCEVLSVGLQGNEVYMWVLVDTEAPHVDKKFYIYGTGHEVENRQLLKFLGTVQQGPFVWHIFQDVGP